MARRLDDPLCFLRVTTTVYGPITPPTRSKDRLVDLARAVTLADSLGDPKASFNAHYNELSPACKRPTGRASTRIWMPPCLWLSGSVRRLCSGRQKRLRQCGRT